MVDARHLDKSPDAFRTISEVADDLELPQHVLRFWETRFTHIRPVKRAGGRRYYRPDDVELLRGIRHLLYSEGYTIKGVQKILKDHGVRHVQAIGYDDGQSLPPVPDRPAAPPPPVSEEAGGIGGLLGGLLPRRRPRLEVDDTVGTPSAFDEPPLPFPDFASFTPRTEDVPEPRRAPSREREPRPAPETASKSPAKSASRQPLPQQRAEPVFGTDDPEDDPYRAAPMRQDPSFEAVPRRPVTPPQRPSRGPASRLPETPMVRELEDPLLPFFDDELPPAEQISEPLDARIRRMKDSAPPAPEPLSGPPEEYIPARARKRSAEDPREVYRDPPVARRADPRNFAPPVPDDLDDELAGQGDLYAEDEPHWQRPARAAPAPMPGDDFPADDRFAPPRPPRMRENPGQESYRSREPDPYPDPRAPMPRDRGTVMHENGRTPQGGLSTAGRAQAEWSGTERGYREPPPAPSVSAHRGARDPFFDAPPPVQAPLVAPPRLGPFLGPMEEYDPNEPESHATYRAELGGRRAAEARREPEQRGRFSDERSSAREARPQPDYRGGDRDYDGHADRDPRARDRQAWAADEDDDEDARYAARMPGEGWRDEADAYAPPEPLRPGPPEQYLPPHLRSEPRMTGAPTPPAPVLSRDDISRLQATLFELTECRRLMSAVLAEDGDDRDGD